MTKQFRIFIALILLFAVSAAKADVHLDGLYYYIDPSINTAEVVDYDDDITVIIIPASIKVDGVTYKVTKLADKCFYDCTSLTSISIPNSVFELGEHCFTNCTSLTNITIPNSVLVLGIACFYGCTSLTSITIPSSVTELGYNCFYGCTSLKSITIPNSVTELGGGCFEDCTSLTSITIPSSVRELGQYCFYGCTSLKEVTCLAEIPPTTEYSFYDDVAQKILYVPAASVEAYKTSSYDWRYFGKILPLSASGIKTVSKGDIGMSVDNGTLTLSNVPENEPVSVYSATGQLLGTGKGNISVDAQGGQMVIVKVGGKSYKILVK